MGSLPRDTDMAGQLIAPLMELMQNDFVQEKASEAAKLFFTSDTVTINLIPALVASALAALLLIPLLALLFQPGGCGDNGGTSYGAPVSEYGAPASSYGAPEYRSDTEGYEEFRSLFTNLLDSSAAGSTPHFELTKRMQDLAAPALTQLGEAAAKLIQ